MQTTIKEYEETIRLAQSGQQAAFAQLLSDHYDMMFKVAYKFAGQRMDAEDITQEAVLRLARGIGGFAFKSSFETWLYRLVINTAQDFYRSQSRRHKNEAPMYEDVVFVANDMPADDRMMCKELLRYINDLPDQLRETVLLVCWHGLKHAEAAQVLSCSEGTVSWRLHEARKILSEKVGKEG